MMAAVGRDVEELSCVRCKQKFTCPDEFEEHISTPHRIGKRFYCALCHYVDASKSGASNHIKTTHMENLPFSCPICDKSYKFYYSLKFHLPVHEGVERDECEFCKKTLDYSDGVSNKHPRSHSGRKPYVCLTCGGGSSFHSSVLLSNHLRAHVA